MNERRLFFSGIILFLFSLILILFNVFITKYLGNNYFPPSVFLAFAVVAISYIVAHVLNHDKNYLKTALKELFYLLLVISLIAFATNAVQYTPFNVIDKHIITFEHALHIHLETLMAWAYQYPKVIRLLRFVYDTLPYQLPLIPLGIILKGNKPMMRRFYSLMLNTAIIGFMIYYFFPTLAPASLLHSPYFLPEQLATGLKFKQIHQHINPTTIEGGMIALPSFHAIWAMILVYCLRPWPILFWPMALFNSLLIISCVLLGWHYPTDILVGVLIFRAATVMERSQKFSDTLHPV